MFDVAISLSLAVAFGAHGLQHLLLRTPRSVAATKLALQGRELHVLAPDLHEVLGLREPQLSTSQAAAR